jgi:hypothetical protein
VWGEIAERLQVPIHRSLFVARSPPMSWLKNTIRYHFGPWLYRHQLSPAVGIQQRQLMQHYLLCKLNGQLPDVRTTGFKVFSQFEEDGILLYLFSLIGEGGKTFIEIGANDGINSNCSNLAIHFGWSGLFFEGEARMIARGRKFYSKIPTPFHPKPTFVQAVVRRENVDQLIAENGLGGDIELLSIDIDGNDYWVWDAITVVRPKVVVIESQTAFSTRNIVVPYDPDYSPPGRHAVYHGASVTALNRLGERKGYRLAAANDLGINLIFLRGDLLADELRAIDPAATLWHPQTQAESKEFEEVKDWEYVEG